jgi:hypothetical protein
LTSRGKRNARSDTNGDDGKSEKDFGTMIAIGTVIAAALETEISTVTATATVTVAIGLLGTAPTVPYHHAIESRGRRRPRRPRSQHPLLPWTRSRWRKPPCRCC